MSVNIVIHLNALHIVTTHSLLHTHPFPLKKSYFNLISLSDQQKDFILGILAFTWFIKDKSGPVGKMSNKRLFLLNDKVYDIIVLIHIFKPI